jgi:DNA polymerase-1
MTAMIVDATNLMMRAVHATERKAMTSHGIDTSALVAFIGSLSRHVRTEKPDKLVLCWDEGGSSRRVALYPGYKASRKVLSADFTGYRDTTSSLIREFLLLANVPYLSSPGLEADDLVAAFWRGHQEDGERTVILSGDKDFLQLLDDGVVQIRPPDERWTIDRVRREFDCEPYQLAWAMALAGDSSDDIPGVPGYGLKTAVKRLREAAWDPGAIVDPRVSERLSQVHLNHQLIDLRNAIPGVTAPEFTPTCFGMRGWDKLLAFLDQFELVKIKKNLVNRVLWNDPPTGR